MSMVNAVTFMNSNSDKIDEYMAPRETGMQEEVIQLGPSEELIGVYGVMD